MPFFVLYSTLSACPDARFLPVERSPEKWAKSYENTIGTMKCRINGFSARIVQCFDGMARELSNFFTMVDGRLTKGERVPEKRMRILVVCYDE